MNLLIDENLSPRVARWACEEGYPAEAAVHVGLAGATDAVVFAYAYRHSQVVVTGMWATSSTWPTKASCTQA